MYRSSPTIKNSKIENNSNRGIYAYSYSDPEIVKNTIRYNSSYGINGNYYCSLELYNSVDRGKNLITNNSGNGIHIGYYSDTYAGSYYNPGYNSIYSNGSYEVAAYYGSNASVMSNYWGASSPPSGEFYADGTSSYTNLFWYSSDQGAGSSLPKVSVEEVDISLAYYYISEKRYEEAEEIFKKIIKEKFDKKESVFALVGLSKCYKKSEKKGFLEYLENEVKNKIETKENRLNSVSLELEGYWLTKEGKYEEAIKTYKQLQNDYINDSEIWKNAKINEGLVYLDYLSNKETAETVFGELTNKNSDEDVNEFITNTLNEYDESENSNTKSSNENIDKETVEKEVVSDNYKLIGNYPNPFNPSTKIRYSLPFVSSVNLEIYDVMGRVVKSFEVNSQTSGRHEIVWNGTNRNGNKVASGIYFYKLKIHSLEVNGEGFEKTAKLLLMK